MKHKIIEKGLFSCPYCRNVDSKVCHDDKKDYKETCSRCKREYVCMYVKDMDNWVMMKKEMYES
jgi:hypothetical protein